MGKVILVSNRLPVNVRPQASAPRVVPSVGGLATALRSVTNSTPTRWVGWPGSLSGLDRDVAVSELQACGLTPVFLSRAEIRGFYEGYCNTVLWPLCHYLLDRLPLRIANWDHYQEVNRRFAEAVLTEYENGDSIWIHDYHLMLLPALLRQARPDARIGFFLHTPFPSFEVFRILPQRTVLVEGMLGADLIGFHTAGYLREFSRSALHLVGAGIAVEQVRHAGRTVQLGVFPIGIDVDKFARPSRDSAVPDGAISLRSPPGCRLAVAIDRLDYTKGMPRRLLAFESLLEMHPELVERVQLVQVAVPSRTRVRAYRRLRAQVDRLVGRINGRFGTARWTPIVYLYRSVPEHVLVALYREADIMLVTPIRDGLNLVSKEFIASRDDEDGVLVLSEFAGASAELAEALHVNPYDIEGTAIAYYQALTMDREERQTRMRALRDRVSRSGTRAWFDGFLARLDHARTTNGAVPQPSPAPVIEEAMARMRRAPYLDLLLDYDGTLVPFAGTPDLARPDAALLELLRKLAERSGTRVHVVTGRRRETLESWLGALPVYLHAEHGYWSRSPGEEWVSQPVQRPAWYEPALNVLREFARHTPGSLIEEKTVGLAWHYRMVDPELGHRQANELRTHLAHLFSNLPVEILAGQKVVELRPHGIAKRLIAARVTSHLMEGAAVAAFGDDATDEDLFSGLPVDALTFHVGRLASRAVYRLEDVRTVRRLLGRLVKPEPKPGAGHRTMLVNMALLSGVLQ